MEFTPIGKRSARERRKTSPLRPSTKINIERPNKVVESFDNTVDNFSPTMNSFFDDTEPRVQESGATRLPLVRVPEPKQLIDNGTSIKQQQQQFESLKQENMGLKVRLFVWEKYYRQTPEQQKAMLDENIELRQKLVELTDDNKAVRRQLDRKDVDSGEKMAAEAGELRRHVDALARDVDARDLENTRLQQRVHELEAVARDQVELQRHVDGLERHVEELEHHVAELQAENRQLLAKVNSGQSQAENLRQQLETQQQQYDQHTHDVYSQHQAEAATEIASLKSLVDELTCKYDNAKNELERAQLDVEQLQADQHRHKNHRQQLADQLELAENQLQRKEAELAALNQQIRAMASKNDDDDTRDKRYQHQLETLVANERKMTETNRKLTETNRKLNKDIAELRDEIFTASKNSTSQLERQLAEQNKRLTYYEEEFERVERELERAQKAHRSAEQQAESLQQQLRALEAACEALQHDIAALGPREQGSAVDELEAFARDRLQAENHQLNTENHQLTTENRQLTTEIDRLKAQGHHLQELQRQIQQLHHQLETNDHVTDHMTHDHVHKLTMEINQLRQELKQERSQATGTSGRFMEQEYQRVVSERNQLRRELEDSYSLLRDVDTKYKKLQVSLHDKESLVDDMGLKLRDMKRDSRFSRLEDDDEKNSLIRANSKHINRIQSLETELESVRQEYTAKLAVSEAKIEVLTQKTQMPMTPDPQPVLSVVNLLEKQLDQSYKDKADAHKQLEVVRKQLEAVRQQLEAAQTEIAHVLDLNTTFEANEKTFQGQIADLEAANKAMAQDLAKVNGHRHKLVAKLKQKLQHQKTEQQIDRKIEDLSSQLRTTTLSTRRQDYRLQYYKLRLYDMNFKVNDLLWMYHYVRRTTPVHQTSLATVASGGATTCAPKFTVVAKMVLAMVRMRRRAAEANTTRQLMMDLKRRC